MGGSCICHPDDRVLGNVGFPIPACEIKLIDQPDMGYTSNDNDENGQHVERGEIAIRGPSVAQGYYELPEKTASDFVKSTDGSPYKWSIK